jgi:uncharacterized membrane protein
MAYIEHTVRIDRPPAEVWRTLADVERWAEWTKTVRSIERRSGAGFAVGSTYRVAQPGLAPATWRITRIETGRVFDWETRPFPGTRVVGSHALAAEGDATRVTLSIRSEGPLAFLLVPVLVPMSRRNLPIEAEGLKQRSEAIRREAGGTSLTAER